MAKRRVLRWLRSSVWADRLLVAIALSPLVVLVIRQVMELGNQDVPCCDFAALELGTRAFLRGEQLVGLYSREGWRHPGPAPFLWSSLFRPLPGHSFAEHQISAAVLSLLAMGTLITALWNKVSAVGRSVVIALVAVFISRFGIDALRVPWNPYGAFLWTLMTVVSTVAFIHGRRTMWAAIAVVSGSMATQTHVGAAPTIVVCFVVIMIVLWRSRHRPETTRSARVVAGVFAVMWFLPLSDLAFGNRNLLKILTGTSGGSVDIEWSDVLKGAMWLMGNSPGHIGETFGPASPFVEVRQTIVLDIIAIVVIIGLAIVALLRWRRDSIAGTLSAVTLASCALTVVALMVSNGPFLRYLLLPIAGLGLISWIVAGLTATRLLQKHEHNVLRILAWPAVLVLTVLSILGMDSGEFTDAYVDEDVQSVVREIQSSCESLPDPAIVDISSTVEWFDALPVIVSIEHCVKVRVIGHVGFLAGQPYQAVEEATPNVFIGSDREDAPGTVISGSDQLNVSTSLSKD
ncbi:MAG: hypothetical protein ACKOI2_13505 [Actinomycetota bacterium]